MSIIDLGLSKEKFFADFYEKKPILSRKSVAGIDFSLSDIDEILDTTDWEHTRFKFNDGRIISPEKYTEVLTEFGEKTTRIINKSVYRLFLEGASLVANRVERQSRKIRRLCDHIEELTGSGAVANGYLTFSDISPFGAHWDTHDVFIVQLIGKKRWSVFEPTLPLPTSRQKSRFHKSDVPAKSVISVDLEAGDLLYIPRGWWHSAVGFNTKTFHVAIGVHPPLGVDYVGWICDQVSQASPLARRSYEHALEDPNFSVEIGTAVQRALQDPTLQEKFRASRLLERRRHASFNLAALVEGAPFGSGEMLVKANVEGNCTCEGGSVLANGKVVLVSRAEGAVIEYLARHGISTVETLRGALGLGPSELEKMLSRLGREDVISVV